MSEHITSTTFFNIDVKDRQGHWHPWKHNIASRSEAEENLAANLDLMSTFYTEAKIDQVEHRMSVTAKSLKHIDIPA